MLRLLALFATGVSAVNRLRGSTSDPSLEAMLPDDAGLPSAHIDHKDDTFIANHLPTDFEV